MARAAINNLPETGEKKSTQSESAPLSISATREPVKAASRRHLNTRLFAPHVAQPLSQSNVNFMLPRHFRRSSVVMGITSMASEKGARARSRRQASWWPSSQHHGVYLLPAWHVASKLAYYRKKEASNRSKMYRRRPRASAKEALTGRDTGIRNRHVPV